MNRRSCRLDGESQADAVIFAVNDRPVRASRGADARSSATARAACAQPGAFMRNNHQLRTKKNQLIAGQRVLLQDHCANRESWRLRARFTVSFKALHQNLLEEAGE
jgi:hypothetical protein